MKKLAFTNKDLDFDLWLLIIYLREAIGKVRQRELYQHGLTIGQSGVFNIIQAVGDKATQAEISRRTVREPHTISHILSAMEKKGLVRKVRDLERKNLVRVELTEKGRKAQHQSTNRESLHKVMSCLSKNERQLLISGLQKLLNNAIGELGMKHTRL